MVTIIVLSIVGILAVIAELVLPGGILGIIGMLCLLGAVGMTFAEFGMTAGTIAVAVLFVFGLATLNIWMKYFKRFHIKVSI